MKKSEYVSEYGVRGSLLCEYKAFGPPRGKKRILVG